MAYALTRRFFVVAVATLALSVPAFAQENPQEAPTEEERMLNEPLLEEMVVTAQKREETVKEIPVSVTALPAST